MLRPEPSQIHPDNRESTQQDESFLSEEGTGSINIQEELNYLEEMLVDSPGIPFTRRRFVDEDLLLDQLDRVRLNLPEAFLEAQAIIEQKEEIFAQAEQYAQEIIDEADRRADEILDEMGLIRRAELEAKQIRERVQQECKALQEKTLQEIEQMRLQAQQEIEQMRQMAIAECEDIQKGADDYADRLLKNIEQQLNDMLKVIRNGRQQLHNEPTVKRPGNPEKDTSTPRPSHHSPKK